MQALGLICVAELSGTLLRTRALASTEARGLDPLHAHGRNLTLGTSPASPIAGIGGVAAEAKRRG
jgi:hypothetical protein